MAAHGENSVKLRDLSPKHKQVASLLAQGLGRTEISTVVDFTPEYVTWLCRDPLFKSYLQEMSEFTDARLEAMYAKVGDAIQDGLDNGKPEDRLRAARLHLEVTGRIGNGERPMQAIDESVQRLNTIANRLLALQSKVRIGETFNGSAITQPTSGDSSAQLVRA